MEGGFRAVIVEIRGHLELAGGACLLFLTRHRRIEGGAVDADLAFAANIGGEVEGEAVGIVQLEGGLAIENFGACLAHRFEFGFQHRHAVFDRGKEAVFLLLEDVGHAFFVGDQFGIGAPHLGDEVRHHLVEEGGAGAQFVTVADRAADDAAQDKAASLIAGNHTVGEQERAGADVVRQHLEAGAFHVRGGSFAGGSGDQRQEQVDLVVGVHMLQHGRNTLQAHAGINRGLGQRMHHAGLVTIELHEHVVPDLNVAVAVFVRRSGRAAPDVFAVVVENLGARTAGAGVTHHPEVVGSVAGALVVADADYTPGRDAHCLCPDVVGLVVLGVDRDPEFVLRQLVDLGQ